MRGERNMEQRKGSMKYYKISLEKVSISKIDQRCLMRQNITVTKIFKFFMI